MKITSSKAMKWLRAFHIVTASIWFGGVACIGVLACTCFFGMSEAEFILFAPIIPSLYPVLILPAAVLTILQGLVYGLFTGWGFKKHRWIVAKWLCVLLLMLCTGAGTIGQMFSVIERVQNQGFTGGLADGGAVLAFITAQILIMAFMICISVLKPWGKKTAQPTGA